MARRAEALISQAKVAANLRDRAEKSATAPLVAGALRTAPPNPRPEGRRTYILTCAQNNTYAHAAFLRNLLALRDHEAAMGTPCELKIARFSYNLSAYAHPQATKAGRVKSEDRLWFDPAIEPYVCDDPERHGSCRWELADGLVWCAEMNILPTAVRPLSGLDAYAGQSSGVFPHAKVALESVPVMPGRNPKFNFTTGTCTQRNYIQKKEGIKAEFHHAYAALLVEVDEHGNWWARHLNATPDGSFYDLTRRVRGGKVTDGHRLEALQWGDVHASEIDADVRDLNWREGGTLDVLRPKYQFMHDLFSMRSRSHHEMKSYEARIGKFRTTLDSVRAEVEVTAKLLADAARPWCKTVVVSSNHDRHLERWLDDADYKADLENAEFFLTAQLERTRALQSNPEASWPVLPWALRGAGAPAAVRYLGRDESFIICPAHPVECGQHGDEGINGARGSTAAYVRMSMRQNKGHDHTAAIRDGVVSAGVCARTLRYAHGPSSWSVSHIGTYRNGKRVILTQRAGKMWRGAEERPPAKRRKGV